ncbi:hypothetical protein ENSA5_07810 [Enhygromyxa salina]|uniref:Uncharacterized protein n=1 Tax=Enhygromyxa salina TaxID=215803 RepID=A0A2S9YHA2_9BACT|nr:hypothetical protein ENSA5_07810 [Enhygromyxa salina]
MGEASEGFGAEQGEALSLEAGGEGGGERTRGGGPALEQGDVDLVGGRRERQPSVADRAQLVGLVLEPDGQQHREELGLELAEARLAGLAQGCLINLEDRRDALDDGAGLEPEAGERLAQTRRAVELFGRVFSRVFSR